ncbi:uncharacterized protein LOC104906887 [Beta vulgaris subsp. vulgaris]|uniref:uncharacterized protein LOC104906887 n=1 Tax=Beta vulgaris subsp. vulgaris TaxID=3555 RepID=UPI0005400F14|nr:uncharacterized protein LOC104906887 [Beta vulgaris subsp. vulgaris]
MAELHGIEDLVVQTPEFEKPLSPISSLKELQNQSREKATLSEWLTIMKKTQGRLEAINGGKTQARTLLNDFEKVQNDDHSIVKESLAIKIEFEDVKEEIEYWESAVVCYVVGANPPYPVMEGFLRRVWAKKGIEKIVAVNKGVFLVRFHNVDQRDEVLNYGFQFFDKKPLIVKQWHAEMDFQKEDIKTVPIWIQLPALDLKYWGERCLFKLVAGIGKPLKLDQSTINKDRLQYARIMIETRMNQDLPEEIVFENEKGVMMTQKVHYEWRPIRCDICAGIGHSHKECVKQKQKKIGEKVWVKKGNDGKKDADGFQKVKGYIAKEPIVVESIDTTNTFVVLRNEEKGELMEVQEGELIGVVHGEGEGEPPTMDG